MSVDVSDLSSFGARVSLRSVRASPKRACCVPGAGVPKTRAQLRAEVLRLRTVCRFGSRVLLLTEEFRKSQAPTRHQCRG
eukprot:8985702-Lingulodinium_polyedra.AAC.1